MPPLTYIANPYSMHVPLWLEAAAQCGLQVRIETSEPEGAGTPANVPTTYLTPRWVKGPSLLRYLWAGVATRLRHREPGHILHAHCSSGNGMVAWMSGHPYIVTTYGSEVLGANDRSRMYRWLLRRILQGAERITATSPQMVEILIDQFAIPRERIHLFDLGLDTETFAPPTPQRRQQLRAAQGIDPGEPVWVAVKRAVPMNRTREMVEAFLRYAATEPAGRLIILCGNGDPTYVDELRSLQASSPEGGRIILVDDWLTPTDVAGWLQLADFALSVPTSDQMSNAVLEAMACGSLPILSQIGGYRLLSDRGASVRWIQNVDAASLQDQMVATASISAEDRRKLQQECLDYIERHYAHRRVWKDLQRLYGLPATENRLPSAA